MELIDIIRSSIILFIVISAAIVFLSFALYKIRNQAKRTKSSIIAQNNINMIEINPEKIEQKSEIIEQKTLNLSPLKTETKEHFEVVNNNFNVNAGQTKWRSNNYRTNVFKFYENAVSSEMFKVKVEEEITS